MDSIKEAAEGLMDTEADSGDLSIEAGSPQPLGATLVPNGVNFAVFSKNATSVTLVLYLAGVDDPLAEISLGAPEHRTGDVWHVNVQGIGVGTRYGYRVDRDPNDRPNVHHFDPTRVLFDPYAKALTGLSYWREPYSRLITSAVSLDEDGFGSRENELALRSLVVGNDFDWQGDRQLDIPMTESIIYELHVRGFTQHESSRVENRGTYEGLIEKIPYLVELGVTTVELLPVYEFDELEFRRCEGELRDRRINFWGYSPLSFFAPKASYAVDGRHGRQVQSFRQMVKAFHDAGIEVILDVVYNHTGEGNYEGRATSLRGFDNQEYYIVDPYTGEHRDYTGCGNTVNCNNAVVADLIVESLRYWVTEMHVDGFRFDLASVMARGPDGVPLDRPPVIERIARDPVLSKTKLIAEAWDAVGLYQVGSFPGFGRFAEWNGKFRDEIRSFVKGDAGIVPALAQRILGSPDLYAGDGGKPWQSINFVTCHDGFTLYDTVSYNEKHNDANDEDNRDGENTNHSWNCGHEGETDDPAILALRTRQMKNLLAILMLSHGTPMILGGDEHGRTQRGNNNAYCQDNEVSWVDWRTTPTSTELNRFVRMLTQRRRALPALRPAEFISEGPADQPGFTWHGVKRYFPDWSHESRSLAIEVRGREDEGSYWLAMNAHTEPLRFELPPAAEGHRWARAIDTSLAWPDDARAPGEEAELFEQGWYRVEGRSVVLLVLR